MARDYKMQKRHYQLIAELIRTLDFQNSEAGALRSAIAKHFADGLRSTNPQFKRELFLTACETDDYPRNERGRDARTVTVDGQVVGGHGGEVGGDNDD